MTQIIGELQYPDSLSEKIVLMNMDRKDTEHLRESDEIRRTLDPDYLNTITPHRLTHHK